MLSVTFSSVNALAFHGLVSLLTVYGWSRMPGKEGGATFSPVAIPTAIVMRNTAICLACGVCCAEATRRWQTCAQLDVVIVHVCEMSLRQSLPTVSCLRWGKGF